MRRIVTLIVCAISAALITASAVVLLQSGSSDRVVTSVQGKGDCQLILTGIISPGYRGWNSLHATRDNCSTWRSYAVCEKKGGTAPRFRYGGWRSEALKASIAGCIRGTYIADAGWQSHRGKYHLIWHN